MTRLLLVGGGHVHIEVLRRLGATPERGLDVVLVTPAAAMLYSGMVPGVIAGHYTPAQAQVALAPLAARAQARFVCDRVVHFDAAARCATLEGSAAEEFDIASLDIGSTPDQSLPGAREHAVPVRPLDGLWGTWQRLQADAARGALTTIAIVGGGAAGVELLLSMHYRLRETLGPRMPRFALVTDQPTPLAEYPPGVRRRFERILASRGVAVHANRAAVAVTPRGVAIAGGGEIAAECVIFATRAAAAPWLATSGVACDRRGFVRVDAHLRSISHPHVFAAGDCASPDARSVPKSGVYAVREGPPLAANLRRVIRGEPLRAYRPQRRALALISTGDRHAVALRPPFAAAGAWVWHWKDWIDRRFVARYRIDA